MDGKDEEEEHRQTAHDPHPARPGACACALERDEPDVDEQERAGTSTTARD